MLLQEKDWRIGVMFHNVLHGNTLFLFGIMGFDAYVYTHPSFVEYTLDIFPLSLNYASYTLGIIPWWQTS